MRNSINWGELTITQSELDNLWELDLFSSCAIDLNLLLILRQRQYFKSFLFTEISVLFLGLVLFFPLNLIMFRNLAFLSNNTVGFLLILAIAIIFSAALLLLFNYYLWLRAKKLKSLTIVLDKVNQYNQLIDNLQIITQINHLNPTDGRPNQQNLEISSEVKIALELTKVSLLKSIEIEKVIYSNQQITRDRYQLFANLEDNLIQFLSLPQNNSHNEYQQLLTEAIQIGLSVHQEVRKIQTLRHSTIDN